MLFGKNKDYLIILCSCWLPFVAMGATKPASSSPAVTVATAKSAPTYPQGQDLYDLYPTSVLYYYGVTVDNPLLSVLTLHQLERWPEHIQTVEVAHTLSPNNIFRRWVSPIVGVVEVAGNMTVRQGDNENTIYEFDPYVLFRWANLPWNHVVNTSFGFAEGVSYASSIPAIERKQNDNTKRFLNYLMFEVTFALPSDPRWQLVARVHHRSGAFGLYHAGNTGSNDIGVGVRYLFD